MENELSKKTFMLAILEILKKYSDKNNRLSQKEIGELVEREYSLKIGRKAIKRNLEQLIDMGYDIEYDKTMRENKAGGAPIEEFSNWYIVREFSDAELRLLIDATLFSKHIPHGQRKELIKKLAQQSNKYFNARIGHIRTMPGHLTQSKELFYTIELLDEAISNKLKVAFKCMQYGVDKKLHPVKNADGSKREYIVSPYQMAVSNGRYYLICNHDNSDKLYHYRLDIISGICILEDEPARPIKEIRNFKDGLNLPKYMEEHFYMFSGDSENVTFRAKKTLVGAILDWFGMNVQFFDITEDEITAKVRIGENDMLYWALQYGLHVEILSPQSLRNKMREAVKEISEKYEDAL
ncbi:MAG: WYL domain-containing protein [Clostridiales bacterium]|jgi:predicted DNA-binding transcriptional regulator YafY|nr:WYL domain-containing protein [Clostridiales bacterium]